MQPNEFTPERATKVKHFKRNRDHTSGADAVKDAGELYLPRESTMQDADYQSHLLSVEYFPAAARTLQSHIGLVFRKQPTLKAPDRFKAIAQVITNDGWTIEELAKWALREYLITNDGGLLVDQHGSTQEGQTKADAEAKGQTPYIARYTGESILEATTGVVGGRKAFTRVRLLEATDRVRQLDLINGAYTVTEWVMIKGKWKVASSVTPLVNGAPLGFIPFVHLSDGDAGASFDDLCALNMVHYQWSSKLTTAANWISKPVAVVAGVDEDVELHMRAGELWRFQSHETNTGYLKFEGEGVNIITNNMGEIAKHMAMLGSRLLGEEKAGVEAAEVVARRQAGENSMLASDARHTATRVTKSARMLAERIQINPDEIDFELSTDFLPNTIDPALLQQLYTLNLNGKLSDADFFKCLQRGEILDETKTLEEYLAELDTTLIDQPVANGPIG